MTLPKDLILLQLGRMTVLKRSLSSGLRDAAKAPGNRRLNVVKVSVVHFDEA